MFSSNICKDSDSFSMPALPHTHVSKLHHMGTTRTKQGTGDVCPSIRAWDTPIDSLSPYCVFLPVYLFSPL